MKKQFQQSFKSVKPSFGQSSHQQLPIDIKIKISQQGQLSLRKTYSIGSAASSKLGKNKLPQIIADSIKIRARQYYTSRGKRKLSKNIENRKNSGLTNNSNASLFKNQKIYNSQILKKLETIVVKNQQNNMNQLKLELNDINKSKLQKNNIKKQKTFEKQDNKDINLQKTDICNICCLELSLQQFQRVSSKCNHYFCASCLQQYIIYKIKTFEDPQCPHEECENILQATTQAYFQLPLDLRDKLKKIRQYQILKQPNKRLCPKENCEGILDLSSREFVNPICNLCQKTFCRKCFFQVHEGSCAPYQLNFFEDTLHYRQCRRCKNIIQKISGCNHMTCRCGNSFCYICGKRWSSNHSCNKPLCQKLNIQYCSYCCCQCIEEIFYTLCINTCSCCSYNSCLSQSCKIIKGIFLFLLWLIFLVPLVLIGLFIQIIFWLSISIVLGCLIYPFIIAFNQLSGIMSVLAIVFFPLTMIGGIIMAFQQIFWKTISIGIPASCSTIQNIHRDIKYGLN